jgi:hypothetical protein
MVSAPIVGPRSGLSHPQAEEQTPDLCEVIEVLPARRERGGLETGIVAQHGAKVFRIDDEGAFHAGRRWPHCLSPFAAVGARESTSVTLRLAPSQVALASLISSRRSLTDLLLSGSVTCPGGE